MRILTAAALFLAVASANADTSAKTETAYFRVELVPSGSLVSIGAPVARGTALLIHAYPDGKLMSLRKTDVRSITAITNQEATKPAHGAVRIADLPMQGGSAPGSSASKPGSPGAHSSPAPSASAPGPRIVPVTDGMAITTSPNP